MLRRPRSSAIFCLSIHAADASSRPSIHHARRRRGAKLADPVRSAPAGCAAEKMLVRLAFSAAIIIIVAGTLLPPTIPVKFVEIGGVVLAAAVLVAMMRRRR
jgi:hypothetical protein